MNDCLLEKLKASVTGDNLPIMGKIKFTYPVSSTNQIGIGTVRSVQGYNLQLVTSNTATDIGFYKSGQSSDPSKCLGKDVTMNETTWWMELKTGNDENAYVLADKKHLQKIVCSNTSAKLMAQSAELSSLTELNEFSLSGDLSSSYPINIHDLSCTALTNLFSHSSRLYGSIYELSSILTLNSLKLQWTNLLSGSLDILFDAWASAGKTGVVRVVANGSNLYYQDSVVGDVWDKDVTFSNGSWTIVNHS